MVLDQRDYCQRCTFVPSSHLPLLRFPWDEYWASDVQQCRLKPSRTLNCERFMEWHNESWWGCADRITRLRYKEYNPIIVFNYYQNHEGPLYYYYPYLFLWNLFFSWKKIFFTDIFAFCVMSVSFEYILLRVHPFSFDETFVSLCLWPREPHDVRRHEIVVKGLQFIYKIRVTHRSFFELIYWIEYRFSQLLQRKSRVCKIWEHRSDKHLILFRSTDIVQFACFWSTPERIKLRSFLFDAMTLLDKSQQFSCMIRKLEE